jgi:geranylgeranyl diphosphate synthase type II
MRFSTTAQRGWPRGAGLLTCRFMAPATEDFAALEATLGERRSEVEAALRELLPPAPRAGNVPLALEDSLFAPAKRVRPILALLVADALRGDRRVVLPAACAVEMVHTASLILDDLPSMDDARSRRGRPACHVVHGEASAILAAFSLLNRAYEILAEGWPGGPGPEARAAFARSLAGAVGLSGLIAGQAVDLEATERVLDFDTLEFIHAHKTGVLFTAAASLGTWAAHASPAVSAAVAAYAKNLGLAFQVVDDILDATATAEETGKDVGQDAKKTTFVSFAGVAGARTLAEELIAASQQALGALGPRAQPLADLARYVLVRRR